MLPDKPSELIRLALQDLELCEESPLYEVDMNVYHEPEDSVCAVCWAGSVIAQTLKGDIFETLGPRDFPEDEEKLYTLDLLRQGAVGSALDMLEVPWKGRGFISSVTYEESPNGFKRDMAYIAEELAHEGH